MSTDKRATSVLDYAIVRGDQWRDAALAAEAKIALVEPFLTYIEDMWDGCEPGQGCTGCEVKRKVAELRAALGDRGAA